MFVNCFVKPFTIFLGVVVILLLSLMEVFSVGGGALFGYTVYGLPKNVRVVAVLPMCF